MASCACTRDAARWRWSRLPIVRAASDGWTTLALQRASDHFERRLLDGESVVPVLQRLGRLAAKFSQDDRHALQNWLLLRVAAHQPDKVATTFHALSEWPQVPVALSLGLQPQQPCCTRAALTTAGFTPHSRGSAPQRTRTSRCRGSGRSEQIPRYCDPGRCG